MFAVHGFSGLLADSVPRLCLILSAANGGAGSYNWRPLYIFEDSPACMNYDSKANPDPCGDCVLMQLVPRERRSEKIPCRHIPFNESGDTLDSLYRYSSQVEIEERVTDWLRSTIRFLEEQREAAGRAAKKQQPRPPANLRGTPLYQKHHPKCANPACPTGLPLDRWWQVLPLSC